MWYTRLICFIGSFICIYNSGYTQSVDPLTGRAIINLPLGEINTLDLSTSVSLSHHGGALRVNEGQGNAGMGWNVNMGGSISREVRGLPDDYSKNNDFRKGWLYNNNAATVQGFTPTADDNLTICTDEAADWNILNNAIGFKNDPEPDIFYFNAPGISGKFIFGADGLPKLLPYQNLTITYGVGAPGFTGFTIKTNTGVVYNFSSLEVVSRESVQYKNNVPVDVLSRNFAYYQLPMNFTMIWQLVSISSSTTGAVVDFTYSPLKDVTSVNYVTRISPNQTDAVDTLYYVKDEFTSQVITKIQAGNYSLEIGWMNSLVSKVTQKELASNEAKTYEFIYKYVVSENVFSSPGRNFLMKVKQQNNCVALTPFTFNYNGIDTTRVSTFDNTLIKVNMPWKTGWGEDFFGYYNGLNNNKNIPNVYFYQAESGGRRLRVTPIPSTTATQILGSSGGMEPNSATMNFGSLSTIVYPTGGVTSFIYEANKYVDPTTNEQLIGSGVRVSSITTGGGAPAYGKALKANMAWVNLRKSYEYTTDDTGTLSSGKILYPPSFAYTDGSNIYRSQSDLGQGLQVLYSRVKETISGQGYIVYKFDLPNMYAQVVPVASKSKVARVAGSSCSIGFLMNGLYNFPFAPSQDLDYMRGQPSRISEYAENGALVSEKRSTYVNLNTGVTVKGLKIEPFEEVMGTNYHYSVYEIPINQSRILWKEYSKVIGELSQADSTIITNTYTYNAKNMLVQSTQTNDDGSESKTFIKYAQDFSITSPAAGDVQANAIFKLNGSPANRSGEVIETYRKFKPIGGVEYYTGGELNIFKENTPGDGTILLYQKKSFPQESVFTPAGATSANFISDAKYIAGTTYEYKNALPVNKTDPITLVSQGTHYTTGLSTPLAAFINCRAENAVYEGFEYFNDRGLSYTAAPNFQPGWTGKRSAAINMSTSLITSSVTFIEKQGTKYRVAMWAKSSQAGIINVQAMNGTIVQSTLSLNSSGTNDWTFIEGFLDVATVANSFSLKISTSSSTYIAIDDFVALPTNARVSHNTFLPLTGITSQSDDRGNSVVINYDDLGRKISTLDRKRNLVEMQEYGLQKVGAIELSAGFSSNHTQLLKSTQVTFTATPTCLSQVSYAWSIFDPLNPNTAIPLPGTLNQVSWTPTNFGLHKVQLKVSKPGFETVSTMQEYCVELAGVTVSLAAVCTNFPSLTDKNIYACSALDDGVRTFTANLSLSSFPGWTLSYGWEIIDVNGVKILTGTISGPNGSTITVPKQTTTYVAYCTPSITKDVQSSQNKDCNLGMVLGTRSYTINYTVNTPCQ